MDGGRVGSGDGGRECVGGGDGIGVGFGVGDGEGLLVGNCDTSYEGCKTEKKRRKEQEFT